VFLEELFRRAGFPTTSSRRCSSARQGRAGAARRPRRRRHAHRQHARPGRSVARIAGDALKTTVLELGGSDPFVVHAVGRPREGGAGRRDGALPEQRPELHRGQALHRARDVAERFEQLFARAMGALVLGDPNDDATDVGPLATEQGRKDVQELVDDAVAKGREVLVGGTAPDGPGWYYPPTCCPASPRTCGCTPRRCSGRSRSCTWCPDLDAALELANDTEFGLGSNAWTERPGGAGALRPRPGRRAWCSSTG
jgi:succinate-semialdehyde dehydrogenase/glutarate-semialdehyde dehydrogenase